MGRWGKFLALSNRDRLNLFSFSLLLPLMDSGLRVLGYPRLRGLLAAYPRNLPKYKGTETDAVEASKHVSNLVSVASRYGLYHATCLRRSLLIWWWLRRMGIQTELRIGVKKVDGQLYAHAWIKLGNEIVTDDTDVERSFSAFNDLPVE
jgi:hypothetical protein